MVFTNEQSTLLKEHDKTIAYLRRYAMNSIDDSPNEELLIPDLISLSNDILTELNEHHQGTFQISKDTFDTFKDLYQYTYQLLRYREFLGLAKSDSIKYEQDYRAFIHQQSRFLASEKMNPFILHEHIIHLHNSYFKDKKDLLQKNPTFLEEYESAQRELATTHEFIQGLPSHSVGVMKAYLEMLLQYVLTVSFSQSMNAQRTNDKELFIFCLNKMHLATLIGLNLEEAKKSDPKFNTISQAYLLGDTTFSRLPVHSFKEIEQYIRSLSVLSTEQLTSNIDEAARLMTPDRRKIKRV